MSYTTLAEKLRTKLMTCVDTSYEEACNRAKREEFVRRTESITKVEAALAKVWTRVDDEVVEDLEPYLEFCKPGAKDPTWSILRAMTSSVATNKNVGRCIRGYLKDRGTGKVLGIFAIGSDIYGCKSRDEVIGWTDDDRRVRLVNVVNVTCCVGMQPVAYNYNIGKLLISMCFSKEMMDEYESRYGVKIACVTTFSINGKSVQYDRIPMIKYIGETAGNGSVKVPEDLYLECVDYMKTTGQLPERKGKLDYLRHVCSLLKVPSSVVFHGQKRGVYLGFTCDKSKDFLCGNVPASELVSGAKSGDEIVAWWKARWAAPRYAHLKATGRLVLEAEKAIPIWAQGVKREEEEEVKEEESKTSEVTDDKREYMREYMKKYRNQALEKVNEITWEDVQEMGSKKELDPSYIAGFFDGDGSVAVNHSGSGCLTVVVSIEQCNLEILIAIAKQYGGVIKRTITTRGQRIKYLYSSTNKNTVAILRDLQSCSILKEPRTKIAYKTIQARKYNAEVLVSEYNAVKLIYKPSINSYYSTRMNIPYIAGLFDAEGCIMHGLRGKSISMTVSITQSSDLEILQAVQDFLKYGTVKEDRFIIYSRVDGVKFLKTVLPYLIVKRDQANETITMYEALDSIKMEERDPVVMKKFETTLSMINDMKHTSDYVSEEVLHAFNAEQKLQNKNDYELRKDRRVENANRSTHGRELKEAHRLEISKAQRLLNQLVSDDQIDTVRKKLKQKQTQKSIAEEMAIGMNSVSRIARGLIVKTTELEDPEVLRNLVAKGKTQPDTAIMRSAVAKRSISIDDVYKIYDWTTQCDRHLKTYDYLTKEISELLNKNLSVTVIKSLMIGRTKYFRQEFTDDMSFDRFVETWKKLVELRNSKESLNFKDLIGTY